MSPSRSSAWRTPSRISAAHPCLPEPMHTKTGLPPGPGDVAPLHEESGCEGRALCILRDPARRSAQGTQDELQPGRVAGNADLPGGALMSLLFCHCVLSSNSRLMSLATTGSSDPIWRMTLSSCSGTRAGRPEVLALPISTAIRRLSFSSLRMESVLESISFLRSSMHLPGSLSLAIK